MAWNEQIEDAMDITNDLNKFKDKYLLFKRHLSPEDMTLLGDIEIMQASLAQYMKREGY